MTKPQWMRVLNYFLYLAFCGLVSSGLILDWRLPGGRANRGLSVWGWDRHDWSEIHLWAGYVFLGLVVVHLLLHVKWLWQVATRKRTWILLGSLGLGLALMAAPLIWPVHKSETPSGKGRGR